MKHSYLFTILIFFFVWQQVCSQNLIIDDGVHLKKGIYKTFEEFKTNSPSITLDWQVIGGDVSNRYALLEGLASNDTVYWLNIQKEECEKIGDIWGFCDGIHVYINMQLTISRKRSKETGNPVKVFKPNAQFNKLLSMGRYCYYFSALNTGMSGAYLTRCSFALDINTGKEIEIQSIKELISSDPELVEGYRNEKFFHEEDLYFKYIKLYSDKHKEEIVRP
jgi:hypothetical protein